MIYKLKVHSFILYLMLLKVQEVRPLFLFLMHPTGQNAGQAATSSGSVTGTTGQSVDIMNPFMSLNYIIYTGNV